MSLAGVGDIPWALRFDDWGNGMGVSVCASLWGGESTTAKLTMNVSTWLKTSCFRSKTRSSWVKLWTELAGSKLPRLSRLRSCTRLPLQGGQFWVFCESVPRQFLYPGFLLFLEQQEAHEYHSLPKTRSVPHCLQPPAIDKEPDSNAKKNVYMAGPLDLSFWSFFDFFAPWYRKKWRGIFCENFIIKFKGKVGQMCHRNCSLA